MRTRRFGSFWVAARIIAAALLWPLAGGLAGILAVGPDDALAQAVRAAPTPAGQAPPRLRRGFDQPPDAEMRYLPNEVILDIAANVPTADLDAIAARHNMTRLETQSFRLTGRTMHRWRLDGGGTVTAMIRGVSGERQVSGAPNYLYALTQDAPGAADANQYAPAKLNLLAAHRLATGNGILVAMIDSGVDASHPDLAGAISANFDAASAEDKPDQHGTGMAGAIAARRTLVGTAPRVGLLTVHAFGLRAAGAQGTTFDIVKGLDWAAQRGARIVNMSFAGPADPRLADALARARRQNMVRTRGA